MNSFWGTRNKAEVVWGREKLPGGRQDPVWPSKGKEKLCLRNHEWGRRGIVGGGAKRRRNRFGGCETTADREQVQSLIDQIQRFNRKSRWTRQSTTSEDISPVNEGRAGNVNGGITQEAGQ